MTVKHALLAAGPACNIEMTFQRALDLPFEELIRSKSLTDIFSTNVVLNEARQLPILLGSREGLDRAHHAA